MPALHPMVVHFPLALVLTAAVVLFCARLARNAATAQMLAVVGTWNLCLGGIAAVCALGSGLGAVLGLDVGAAAHRAISLHMQWAMVTTVLLVLLSVWRGAGMSPASKPSPLFLLLLLAACAALLMTGYRGGINVYRYGIGVQAPQTYAPGMSPVK